MKNIFSKFLAIILCCFLATSCEIDNFTGPDATIQGTFYDHNGQALQVNHGASYLRMREISWIIDDPDVFIGNRNLAIQQDGTYRNTKQFSGEYRMLPYQGNFFPYDDANADGDDAGDLVKISGTTTKDFTVTPYLTIEWVEKPTVTADLYLECTVRFIRNQKSGYEMPDLREGRLQISRMVNTSSGNNTDLYPTPLTLNNSMEGQDIKFRSAIPLKYTGIDYWIRVTMNCQTAAGKPETNYPGMGQENCSTIEKIHVP